MSHSKAEVVARFLPATQTHKESATAYAPSNIALCKYWGKRDSQLNLPTNASLSISLGHLGTTTTLNVADADRLTLNHSPIQPENDANSEFYKKVFEFIDLFRRDGQPYIHVDTVNTIPTAAGLASSASGFAALTLAINDFFNLNLPLSTLSAFARMGSGSASRSLYTGFVQWHKGSQSDGMDSFAQPIPTQWPSLCIGLIKVSTAKKKIDSRAGMTRTVETSHLYSQWPKQAEHDLGVIQDAIAALDFNLLGQTAEHNALSMHATMISTWPPVLYWQADSVTAMHTVWALREQGVPVYFTMDAGPNLKLLFENQHKQAIKDAFGDIDIITPFT